LSAKKWLRQWGLMFFICLSIVGIVNYVIDPQYIFKNYTIYRGQLDVRFSKVNYLKENNGIYNSYMMGSSRIGTTHPSSVEKYERNKKFYNFWIGGANLGDILVHLKYFIKEKYSIKTLYIQVGLQNMKSVSYDVRAHPEVLDNSLYIFYIKNLFSVFYDAVFLKLFPSENDINLIEMEINNGYFKFINRDLLIESNKGNYVHIEDSFKLNNKRSVHFTTKKDFGIILFELNKLCRKNNIKLITFVTPHNKVMMDSYVLEDYFEFLRVLSKYNSFYDFSGYNSVTTNNYNYYESSHYLPKVGELISARIFGDETIFIPKDFGFLVTNKNIEGYLDSKRSNISEYELKK